MHVFAGVLEMVHIFVSLRARALCVRQAVTLRRIINTYSAAEDAGGDTRADWRRSLNHCGV